MEFLEFNKQMSRLCNSYHQCEGRPFESNGICPPILEESEIPNFEQIVEQWVKEHPIVTNGDKFREVFGCDIQNFEYSHDWLNAEYKPPKGEE